MKRLFVMLLTLILILVGISVSASAEEIPAPTAPTEAPEEGSEISWIQLTTKPAKIQYVVNEDELDVTGGVLTVYYVDGTEELVTVTEDMVTNFDNSYVHTRWLNVRYGGHSDSYRIAVVESEDQPLVIDSSTDMGDSKLVYFQNQALALDGAVLILEYSDGTVKEIPVTADMVPEFRTEETGHFYVSVYYEGESYSGFSYQVVSWDMLSGTCGKNVWWQIHDSGLLEIWGNGEITKSPWREFGAMIRSLEMEGEITELPGSAFAYCERLTEAELPDTLTRISDSAFYHCSGLERVTIPEGITEIGDWAFTDCVALRSLALPEGLTEIWYNAFQGCTGLESVTFPQSLTDIDSNAFAGCTGLTEIEFPKKLDYLGWGSFHDCTGLKKITFTGKKSPSGNDIFEGVTATAYYPGTTYWGSWFFENCGGDIEWIPTGETVRSIDFEYAGRTEFRVGEEIWRSVTGVPSYVGIDCEFTADNDVVEIVNTSGSGCALETKKPGSAVITATDKRSGCKATITVRVSAAKEISCPYEETITSDTGSIVREYFFTPEETGEYLLFSTGDDAFMRYGSPFRVSELMEEGDYVLEPTTSSMYGNDFRSTYSLQTGKNYKILMEHYMGVGGPGMVFHTQATFRLARPEEVTGIEIIGGDRTEFGAVGERFVSKPIYVKLYPENAVATAELEWESSNPGLMDILPNDDYSYHVETYGRGSAVITAKYGQFSDSITVTTKKPKKLELNTPVQVTLEPGESTWYAFTPSETGRYALRTDRGAADTGASIDGRYYPEDIEFSSSALWSIYYGTYTAGVTYYVRVNAARYEEGPVRCTVTVKKEEVKPTAMELSCYGDDGYNSMTFAAEFIPSNSYDQIVSWESSDPDIMDCNDYIYGTHQYFDIYGSGEVTVTAVSESGLWASCTVTVGQCYNGHTYGLWKQTKAATCTLEGRETATCICGKQEHRAIPAVGHSYDNSCDTACNECGAVRAPEHDFSGKWGYSETAHWQICSICNQRSEIQNHIPGPAATTEAPQTCTECGYAIRGPLTHSHQYGTELTVDESGHWYACDGCSARKGYEAHSYDHVCDADCNTCGYIRKNIHVSDGVWISDKTGHWQSCSECEGKVGYAVHVPGAPATAATPQICSVCLYEIQKATGSTPSTIRILTQPADAFAEAGEVAEVTVEAEGEGLRYAWYYKNNDGNGFALTSAFIGPKYSVTMSEARSGRQVYCVITDKYGHSETTDTVTLTLAAPLVITRQPENVTAAPGETAEVSLEAEGDGLCYSWYYKNAGSADFSKTGAFVGNTYSVVMSEARSGRQVYCLVTDAYGRTVQTDTVSLSMLKNEAKILSQSGSLWVPEGEKAVVTVEAEGDGLTYAWYYKNPGASKYTYTSSFKGNTYSVTMNEERSGRYVYCKVTDAYGNTVKSKTVSVNMQTPLEILTQPKSVRVDEGATAKVTVKAQGDGLTYKWYYKNPGASKYTYTSSFTGNSYSITMNESRDGRYVYCKVYDKYGNFIKTNTVSLRMK